MKSGLINVIINKNEQKTIISDKLKYRFCVFGTVCAGFGRINVFRFPENRNI